MSEGAVSRWVMRQVLIGPPLKIATRLRVEGLENVPGEGALIVASNHLSFIDSIVIPIAAKRTVHFLGKAEYFQGTGLRGASNPYVALCSSTYVRQNAAWKLLAHQQTPLG